jgi:hypothetical protein
MNQQISPPLAEVPGFPVAATKPSAPHSRRCSVCHHPDRIWIELKFIEWNSPSLIADEFDLYDRDSIYHHAHATGLFDLRRRNILCVYENLLERVQRTQITSRGILFAIDRLERAVRSRLPSPAAEIQTTVTRDTELVVDFKTEEDDEDEYYQQEVAQVAAPVRKDQPVQPVASGRESASQLADSESQHLQHTPTDVPDSKQPESPETRQSLRAKMRDPETSAETKFARVREQISYLNTGVGLGELKPPD